MAFTKKVSTGYDATKDKIIYTALAEVGECKLKAIVYSYDGREGKVQIHREIKNKETGQYIAGKQGRFNKQELVVLSALLKEAYDKI